MSSVIIELNQIYALKKEVISCNIIYNSQDDEDKGIFYSFGNSEVFDSCIIENNAKNMFYTQKKDALYNIMLSNCTIDDKNSEYISIISEAQSEFINIFNIRLCDRGEFEIIKKKTKKKHMNKSALNNFLINVLLLSK